MSKNSEYVKAAGRIDIDGAGKIKVIEPESGHYRPNYEENKITIEIFN